MRVLLSEPVDTLSPPRIEADEAVTWVSPAGNFCTGLSYMDECGHVHFCLLAYQIKEVLE